MSISDQVAFLHQQISALNEQILFLRQQNVRPSPSENGNEATDLLG